MEECNHEHFEITSHFTVMGVTVIRRKCLDCNKMQDADIENNSWYNSPVYTLS